MNFVRSDILSKVTWCGAWSMPTDTDLGKLETAVEEAVLGKRWMSRSKMITWQAKLLPHCNPRYLCDLGTTRYQVWRAVRKARGAARAKRSLQISTSFGKMGLGRG